MIFRGGPVKKITLYIKSVVATLSQVLPILHPDLFFVKIRAKQKCNCRSEFAQSHKNPGVIRAIGSPTEKKEHPVITYRNITYLGIVQLAISNSPHFQLKRSQGLPKL